MTCTKKPTPLGCCPEAVGSACCEYICCCSIIEAVIDSDTDIIAAAILSRLYFFFCFKNCEFSRSFTVSFAVLSNNETKCFYKCRCCRMLTKFFLEQSSIFSLRRLEYGRMFTKMCHNLGFTRMITASLQNIRNKLIITQSSSWNFYGYTMFTESSAIFIIMKMFTQSFRQS